MADKKEKSIKWLLVHCLYYELVMILVLSPIFTYKLIVPLILLGISHLFIDIIKYVILTKIRKSNKYTDIKDRNAYFIDQILHIASLLVIAYLANDIELKISDLIIDFFNELRIPNNFVLWVLTLLIIHKPANITIQKLLIKYKPEKKDNQKRDRNAGRLIGTIERIIMLILISNGQYSAIGLVLTAKSVARYDRIAKEEDFAEYYLLGTLLSTLIVIVCSYLVN